MKKLMIIIGLMAFPAYADDQPNLTETTQDSQIRHSEDRIEIYRQNNNAAPLGGYSEKFGDSAPAGTLKPGYVDSPKPVDTSNTLLK